MAALSRGFDRCVHSVRVVLLDSPNQRPPLPPSPRPSGDAAHAMTPFVCSTSTALADAHQLVRCLCVAASGEPVAQLYPGSAASVDDSGATASGAAADTGAGAGAASGSSGSGAGARSGSNMSGRRGQGGRGSGAAEAGAASPTVADAPTVRDAVARGGRLTKLKRLGRERLLDAVQVYHADMVRRGAAAVTGARHACTWRHFSTTGGIWFRNAMSLLARVLLWVLGYARVVIALLFCTFVYLFFVVGRWLINL